MSEVPSCCGCPCEFPAPDSPPPYMKATFLAVGCAGCDPSSVILERQAVPGTDQSWRYDRPGSDGMEILLECMGCPREYEVHVICWESDAGGGRKASVVSCSPFKVQATIQLEHIAVQLPCGSITIELAETAAP